MNAELSISYLDSLSTLFSYQGLLSGDLYRLLPPEQASWFPLNPSVQSADNA